MREIFHTSKRRAVHVITSAFPLVCLVCVLLLLVSNSKPVCHWTKVLPTQVKIYIFTVLETVNLFHQLLKTRFLYLQAKNNIYIFISLDTKDTLWQTCIDTCFQMLSQVLKLEKTLQLKSTLFFKTRYWYILLFFHCLFIFTIIKKNTHTNKWKKFCKLSQRIENFSIQLFSYRANQCPQHKTGLMGVQLLCELCRKKPQVNRFVFVLLKWENKI